MIVEFFTLMSKIQRLSSFQEANKY